MAKRNPAKDLGRFLSMAVGLAYCGGLAWYLMPYASFTKDGRDATPTVLGLGIIGILIGFGFLIFIVRAVFGYLGGNADNQTSAISEAGDGNGGQSGFDADEIIARYMAQNRGAESSEASPIAPAAPAAPMSTPGIVRPGFGRKAT